MSVKTTFYIHSHACLFTKMCIEKMFLYKIKKENM